MVFIFSGNDISLVCQLLHTFLYVKGLGGYIVFISPNTKKVFKNLLVDFTLL